MEEPIGAGEGLFLRPQKLPRAELEYTREKKDLEASAANTDRVRMILPYTLGVIQERNGSTIHIAMRVVIRARRGY